MTTKTKGDNNVMLMMMMDMVLLKLLHGFVKVVMWICQTCPVLTTMPKMMMRRKVRAGDTSGHGFVKVATWICQSCYVDLSKLLCGFVKVVLF